MTSQQSYGLTTAWKAFGACFLQEDCPTAFVSKLLADTEVRYTSKELISMVVACNQFHMYLYGRSFCIESNNRRSEIHLMNLISIPIICNEFYSVSSNTALKLGTLLARKCYSMRWWAAYWASWAPMKYTLTCELTKSHSLTRCCKSSAKR